MRFDKLDKRLIPFAVIGAAFIIFICVLIFVTRNEGKAPADGIEASATSSLEGEFSSVPVSGDETASSDGSSEASSDESAGESAGDGDTAATEVTTGSVADPDGTTTSSAATSAAITDADSLPIVVIETSESQTGTGSTSAASAPSEPSDISDFSLETNEDGAYELPIIIDG